MSKPIVEVHDISLSFLTSFHRAWSWKDIFVKLAKNPFSLMPSSMEKLRIVENLSVSICPGDRVALVGVNGAGKTSLCRCIAGFYRPNSGKVNVNGQVRALFDVSVGIQPELTGRENAMLLAELLFPGEPDKDRLVEEALDFSELGEFLDMPFRIYSKGMQARLGLSMAALKASDLLILDEVFDGADAFFKEKISRRMRELVRDSGAVIFVSHEPLQIKEVCNRLLLLNDGKIIFDGDVDEGLKVYESLRPQESIESGHV